MNKNRWKLINDIVDDLLRADEPSAQNEIIKNRCGDDEELMKEVMNLLESIENSSEYWDSLFHTNRLFIGDLTDNFQETQDNRETLTVGSLFKEEHAIPTHIGHYSIKKRIGIGGMGEVYLAGRTNESFHQNVALKLIRHGISTHDQARRFEQERTILSSLNHPNIARLLDGGISEDGRSYYVMEYVDGIPITEYCTKHNLGIFDRLSLFKQVCRAVQYAHSNFIVHRDLKPDNLLVNSDGVVKILDFGIAKMIDESLDEQWKLQTSAGLRLLSLKHAAPEQLTLDPITTATDVYALGVLLYELLSSTHPYNLKGKNLQESEYIIRHEEPRRPSLVAERWQSKLKGDLDAIILKALRKEAQERYESAQNLMMDIESFEKSMPVSARHDSISYRFRKFMKRHSIPLSFAFLTCVILISFALYYTHRIAQEKHLAELQAQKAEQVTLFLMDMFEASSPSQTGGEMMNVQDMLLRGENEAAKLEGYPEIQAQMYEVIGEIYRRLGQYNRSESILSQSLQIRQEIFGNIHPETVGVFDKLGLLLINMGKFSAADSLLSLALDIRENHLHTTGPSLAETLSNLAYATRRKGDYVTAEKLYRRSLTIREEHLGPDHPRTLENMNSLGVLLHYKAKYDETEVLFREILERRESMLAPIHPDIAISQNSLGALLMNIGNYHEADSLLNQALSIRKKLYGNNHPFVALTLNNLALSQLDQSNPERARKYAEEAYRIRLEQLGDENTSTAITKFTLAKLMLEIQKPDSALHLFKDAYKTFRDNLSETHSFSAQSLLGIGTAYLAKKNLPQAKFYFEEGFNIMTSLHHENSLEFALANMQYAPFLIETGEIEKANQQLNAAYKTLQFIEEKESERQKAIERMLSQITNLNDE